MKLLYVQGCEPIAAVCADPALEQAAALKWLVRCVADTYDAIDYLAGFKRYANRRRFPLPDIVWLNLNSQTSNGLDLLAWIRGEAQFKALPIVASCPRALKRCALALGARACFPENAEPARILRYCGKLFSEKLLPWNPCEPDWTLYKTSAVN